MNSIAFTFSKNGLYYACLSGTKVAPTLLAKNKITIPANHSAPELVDWYEKQIAIIFNGCSPQVASFKLTINNVTNDYVKYAFYGQAILNLICHQKNVLVHHLSPSALVPSRFNQPKGTVLHTYINNLIGSHPPHWDKNMKDCVLIALNYLP